MLRGVQGTEFERCKEGREIGKDKPGKWMDRGKG